MQYVSPFSVFGSLFHTIFFLYPMATMWLLVIFLCEIAVRKFIYYRLLSLAIIVDWQPVGIVQALITHYFVVSFLVLNGWAAMAAYQVSNASASLTVVLAAWLTIASQTLMGFLMYK